ncbi:MAG: preprotein translocase subunit SecG, partial [Myxococcales bacterium]|nr:preprotein translocase subunit SecG [Myxococcales bacterium]
MGARGAATFLSKLTVFSASLFMVLSIVLALLASKIDSRIGNGLVNPESVPAMTGGEANEDGPMEFNLGGDDEAGPIEINLDPSQGGQTVPFQINVPETGGDQEDTPSTPEAPGAGDAPTGDDEAGAGDESGANEVSAPVETPVETAAVDTDEAAVEEPTEAVTDEPAIEETTGAVVDEAPT